MNNYLWQVLRKNKAGWFELSGYFTCRLILFKVAPLIIVDRVLSTLSFLNREKMCLFFPSTSSKSLNLDYGTRCFQKLHNLSFQLSLWLKSGKLRHDLLYNTVQAFFSNTLRRKQLFFWNPLCVSWPHQIIYYWLNAMEMFENLKKGKKRKKKSQMMHVCRKQQRAICLEHSMILQWCLFTVLFHLCVW